MPHRVPRDVEAEGAAERHALFTRLDALPAALRSWLAESDPGLSVHKEQQIRVFERSLAEGVAIIARGKLSKSEREGLSLVDVTLIATGTLRARAGSSLIWGLISSTIAAVSLALAILAWTTG